MKSNKTQIGDVFDNLTVLQDLGTKLVGKGYRRFFLCKCKCGKEAEVMDKRLKNGNTTSCGCLSSRNNIGERNRDKVTKHGCESHPLYSRWYLMVQRCHNPNSKSYKWYGAKGRTVCDEWRTDVKAFIQYCENILKWTPECGLTIDRINNKKGYYPGNIRFATMEEQQNNRSNNHWITYCGEKHTLAQWSKILEMPYDILEGRINRLKWTIHRAFTQEIRKY